MTTQVFGYSGTAGPLTWDFTDSILTISGNGAMPDYAYGAGSPPWWGYIYDIRTVIIEDGVTSIGNYAFYFCKMTEISLPSTLLSIGESAFWQCENLKSVTIPEGVTSMGEVAFYWCKSLTSVSIPSSLTTISERAFVSCTSLKTVTIAEGVKSIGTQAFNVCRNLTSITIPNSVTSIGESAFGFCGFTYFTIPSGVTTISDSFFLGDSSLISVTFPKSVTHIGTQYGGIFSACTSLSSITVQWSNPSDVILTPLRNYVFRGTLSNLTLYVPAGTKALYEAAPVWKEFGTIIEGNAPQANENISNVNVFISEGNMNIQTPKATTVFVYTPSGSLYKQQTIPSGDTKIPLPKGIYFVVVGNQSKKIVVQ